MLEVPPQGDAAGQPPNKDVARNGMLEAYPGAGAQGGDAGESGLGPTEAPTPPPPAQPSKGHQGADGGAEPTLSGAPGEDGAAQLRGLGRQLLLGWSEALAALSKLPGVGAMRVDALAARLQALAAEASPVGTAAAAAAAAAAAGEPAAAAAFAAPALEAAAAPGAPPSRGGTPPPQPATELAGPACAQQQAYSDPVDMFATAAKSAHLSYPELLHAFAASAEGLDDEALADYLFNLAMLCAEPPDNELVVRPVLSLPQNSEEQQQYRRRQASGGSAPVDAMLAAMQQQQGGGGGGGGGPPRSGGGASPGLTHEAIWQQIVSQQPAPHHGGGYGRLAPAAGRAPHHHSPARSKSDMLAGYQQALGDPQVQGMLRGASQQQQQQYAAAVQQQQQQYAAAGLLPPMPPPRGLHAAGSSLAKSVSMPERDLWLAAASLASEAEQKQQEAVAAAAAAASASFSFHPQPPSPSFGRMQPLAGSSSAGGSGLWSSSAGGSGSAISRSAGGSGGGPGGALLRGPSDITY